MSREKVQEHFVLHSADRQDLSEGVGDQKFKKHPRNRFHDMNRADLLPQQYRIQFRVQFLHGIHYGIDRSQKFHPLIANRLHSSDTDIMNARNGKNNQWPINYQLPQTLRSCRLAVRNQFR